MVETTKTWVFVGEGAKLPCGTFSSLTKADETISRLKLTGLLTAYPNDEIVYEWAIGNDYFRPTREMHKSSDFIQQFTSASLEHYHYLDGIREG